MYRWSDVLPLNLKMLLDYLSSHTGEHNQHKLVIKTKVRQNQILRNSEEATSTR